MTISNLASYAYSNYAYTSSAAYTKNAPTASEVSKQAFNVSNLTNALGSLENAASSNFVTLQNVDSFVKSSYQFSQLDVANKLSSVISSNGSTQLLSGNTSLAGMYGLLGSELSASTDAVESLFASSASSSAAIQQYAKNLSAANVASLLDITV